MLKVVSGGLWDTIKRLAKRRAQCSAAVAYVSTDDWLSFREGDLLVTDASDRAIAEGLTSAAVLSRAHRRGVMLYSLGGLHAKVLVLGRTAVVGSANLSRSSRSLTEAAVVSDDATMVAMAKSFVHRLTDYARPIDARFLARISNIPVERGPRPGGRGRSALA